MEDKENNINDRIKRRENNINDRIKGCKKSHIYREAGEAKKTYPDGTADEASEIRRHDRDPPHLDCGWKRRRAERRKIDLGKP